jgi:putative peptide zinc metalloprotease protein
MADSSKTFSESWYRVATQRICLRPVVKVRRQNFRGERWVVLENPFSNQYFRLRPAAYEFIARLNPDQTVEDVWQQCLTRFPDAAPSQEAVLQLLSQLYFANLLQYDLAADSAQLFERYQQRRQRELGFRFLNLMFMRFPLFDPDRFLVKALPVLGKLISPAGAILWLVVIGFGLSIVAGNFGALQVAGEGLLATNNLFLLYLSLILVKACHEFGHAFFCRKFGGEVHVMGIMLMIFTPMPYVDATSSWSFRERWKRVLVGAAGMIVELFIAALAAFFWAKTGPGAMHSIAYNIMFVASVSTIIFNINPLMRFDGYYILSDLLEIPNLNQRAATHLRHLVEHYLFGVKNSDSPASTRREAGWLTFFGLGSNIYRVMVFAGVLLAVADRFLIIGIVMAAACLISWGVVPLVRFFKYLSANPRLDRVRPRALAVTAGIGLVLIILLAVVPFPYSFRAPGVLVATQRTVLASKTSGIISVFQVKPGNVVQAGQPLLQMENPQLELELAGARSRLDQVNARLLLAIKDQSADMAPLSKLRDSISDQLAKLKADFANLTVRSPHAGVWVSPEITDQRGSWLLRGGNLGVVINPAAFQIVATVREEDAKGLFGGQIRDTDARLDGESGVQLSVNNWKVVPGGQQVLPSAALGWAARGEVPVAAEDNAQGNKTVEPFFEVRGDIVARDGIVLLDGRSGKIRFQLPPEPLLPRWLRSLWQLLQKRYEI